MNRTTYRISQMDCPGEENLIRMRLADEKSISEMRFDIPNRTLEVFHTGGDENITQKLAMLNLGSSIIESVSNVEYVLSDICENNKQWKVLWIVLSINFGFFIIEMTTGIVSKSMGLIADSLDMLADALVYGMSLMAVGMAVSRKKKVALYSGILQIILAVIGLTEVIHRFVGVEQMPHFQTMIGISLLALVANSICLWLLQRTKSKDAHMRASVIFSANDVIINTGVIVAGFLVWISDSQIPDLIIGIVVFLIVIRGAVRILKLAK